MYPRASRSADMVASVPELTSRTFSTGVPGDELLGQLDLARR